MLLKVVGFMNDDNCRFAGILFVVKYIAELK